MEIHSMHLWGLAYDMYDEEPYDVSRGSFPNKSHRLSLYRMSDNNYHQLVLIHPLRKCRWVFT